MRFLFERAGWLDWVGVVHLWKTGRLFWACFILLFYWEEVMDVSYEQKGVNFQAYIMLVLVILRSQYRALASKELSLFTKKS